MERRDLLKDQIEQMGKVLAEIVSSFLGLKSKGRVSEGIEISKDQLKGQFDIDIETMMALNSHELKDYLKVRNLTAGHIETLSDYFTELGKTKMDTNNQQVASSKLKKALELLDVADEISGTMSFERMEKRNEIENLL
jgi:hypothetical protein